jgi:predicted Zn-dependent protease
MNTQSLMENFLKKHGPESDHLSLRFVEERTTSVAVRNEKPEGQNVNLDRGVMIEVLKNGHLGYSGTCHLTPEGLEQAYAHAKHQTELASSNKVHEFAPEIRPLAKGTYESHKQRKLSELSLKDIIQVLIEGSRKLNTSEKITTRRTNTMNVETKIVYLSNRGHEISQEFDMVVLDAAATAQKGTDFQTRTMGGFTANSYQVGAEALANEKFYEECQKIAEDAVRLVEAEECPSRKMKVLIAPDQMMLQIHESIGHPLEIDRILGDERNFAGWSFVKLHDIGSLQYGSKLMNVTFDPHIQSQLASYAFDDGAQKATKEYLIKDGILVRGLGGLESQLRSKKPGVANFRSASWNRAPIDRMANINLEPGTSKLEDMISSVENGILLRSNRSWSIDDYRNKFQFGCEFGQLIEDGRLTKLVKNPNYRGTTLNFWRNLAMVGDQREIYGTPYCGKGEPSQVIRVGHASPYCLFEDVEVFGGQS